MRKLLIVMLVLGVASVAGATPIITVSDTSPTLGSTFTITISGTAAEATGDGGDPVGGASGAIGLDYGTYSNCYLNPFISWVNIQPTITTAAGGGAGVIDSTGAAVWTAAPPGGDWSEATDVDTGLWFTWTLNADSLGTTLLDFMDASFNPGTTQEINVVPVPEPMTMALLGLGGLFLRRRK